MLYILKNLLSKKYIYVKNKFNLYSAVIVLLSLQMVKMKLNRIKKLTLSNKR